MGNKPNETLRLYQDCDDLMMYNWERITKTNDLRWLIVGFDGYGKEATESELKQLNNKYRDIVSELNDLSGSNESRNYFDLTCSISDSEARISIVAFCLQMIDTRPLMSDESFNTYIEILKNFRFNWNKSKPKKDELQRLDKQLEAVKMKFDMLLSQKSKIESKVTEKISLRKIKQRVETAISRTVDFRSTSLSEWIYILDDLSKKSK